VICMAFSMLPEVGTFAIPFGLVAVLNKRAEQEGKQVSTAVQMALLNCCVTVGQQICTMTLASVETRMPLATALPLIFVVAAAAKTLAGTSALCLDDRAEEDVKEEVKELGAYSELKVRGVHNELEFECL